MMTLAVTTSDGAGMPWLAYVVASMFFLLGGVCVVSVILSIPGAWLLLALALIVELTDSLYLPAGNTQTFSWWLLVTCAGLVLASELIELAAGMAGAKAGGSSKRGMWGALIGGVAGALVGTAMLPIVGTLIGALVGTFIGAVIGETTGAQAKTMTGSVRPAIGATIGRVAGTLSKIGIAIAVWIVLSVAAFWP